MCTVCASCLTDTAAQGAARAFSNKHAAAGGGNSMCRTGVGWANSGFASPAQLSNSCVTHTANQSVLQACTSQPLRAQLCSCHMAVVETRTTMTAGVLQTGATHSTQHSSQHNTRPHTHTHLPTCRLINFDIAVERMPTVLAVSTMSAGSLTLAAAARASAYMQHVSHQQQQQQAPHIHRSYARCSPQSTVQPETRPSVLRHESISSANHHACGRHQLGSSAVN